MKSFVALSSSFVAAALPLLMSGCMLDTRSQNRELDEKATMRKSVANLQQQNADVSSRFADVEDDVRKANGRIEALETRMQRSDAATADKAGKTAAALEARMSDNDKAYREEFIKLHTELDALKAQIASQQASAQREATVAAKDPFASAESKFEAKNYQSALIDYKTYREKNPTGKHVATASYKMGVSFQELGMFDEAKLFYEDVISRFPKSKEAASAKSKLKTLKKK